MELTNAEIWAILGVLMIAIEIFSITFFFLFFGVGALVTSFLAWMGILDSTVAQLIVFGIVSAASLLVFRKQLVESFSKKGKEYNEFSGERATVLSPISAVEDGKVFFRGTEWLAFTEGNSTIPKGSHVTIKKADGIRLLVEAI